MKLQKFGIEIRKIGNIDAIYQDVDLILEKYNILNSEININVQSQAIAHSLQKMFKTESYFSICTIKNCAKLSQIYIPEERMNVYDTIHCISWNEMLPEFRQMIIAMVLDDFRSILNN